MSSKENSLWRVLPRCAVFAVAPKSVALLALALTTVTLVACGKQAAAPATAVASALTVSVVAPEQRTVERTIVASGSIAPWQEMSLGVELSSVRVARVLVDVGTRVKRGQALIEMDARTLQVELQQARARVAEADAALVLARANGARGRKLKEQQLISVGNADELIAGEARAAAQRQSAVAQLDAAKLKLGFATLRAPDDGVISARAAEPGQIASPGTELLRLIRQNRLEWRAELAGADLARVTPGASVEVDGVDGARIAGTVRSVSPSLDPRTRTGLIYADLADASAVRAGMFAAGRVKLGASSALVIPRAALLVRDGIGYVFVMGPEDKVTERRVESGTVADDWVEVRSGLTSQDRIVLQGAGFLADGDRVTVTEAVAAGNAPPDAATGLEAPQERKP